MVIQKYRGTKANTTGLEIQCRMELRCCFGIDGVIHFYVKNQYDCLLWYFSGKNCVKYVYSVW